MTSSGRSVGSSSVIRLMYRGAIPRSVGRDAKLAASTRTQSSESGGGTFARIVCSSWRPVRSNSTGMVAERIQEGVRPVGWRPRVSSSSGGASDWLAPTKKLVTEPLQEGLSTLPVTAL